MNFENRKSFQSHHILVLAEVPDVLGSACDEVTKYGYVPVPATNMKDAVEIARVKGVNLVIADGRGPEAQVKAFVIECKKFCPTLPIILFTDENLKLMTELYKLGADTILPWPPLGHSLHKTMLRYLDPQRKGEFRIYNRYESNLNVTWRLSGMEFIKQSTTLNLSAGGLFILEKESPPKKKDIVNFNINRISGTGLVRWSRTVGMAIYPAGFGIEFITPSKRLTDFISTFNSTATKID